MQGNVLWEMEKHGYKLPASESGFGFEIGYKNIGHEQPIAKLQFSTIEDSASPSFHQYFKTCLLKMMIVCKNFSDAKFFRYDYANAID